LNSILPGTTNGDKTLLGHAIKGRGLAEVEDAVDILVHHPATATRLARQIATYFISDNPAEPLVQRMAQTSRPATAISPPCSPPWSMHRSFLPVEIRRPVKDPVQYVLSAVRLAL